MYPKENLKDEVDLEPTDKCQRFLQIATFLLGVCGEACPKYLVCFFLQNLKKEVD